MRGLWIAFGWVVSIPAAMACGTAACALGAARDSEAVSLLGPLLVGILAGWKIRDPVYTCFAFLLTGIVIGCVLAFFLALALMSTSGTSWVLGWYFLLYPGTLVLAATAGAALAHRVAATKAAEQPSD